MPGEAIVNKGITFTASSPSVFDGHNRRVQVYNSAIGSKLLLLYYRCGKPFKLNDVLGGSEHGRIRLRRRIW